MQLRLDADVNLAGHGSTSDFVAVPVIVIVFAFVIVIANPVTVTKSEVDHDKSLDTPGAAWESRRCGGGAEREPPPITCHVSKRPFC